MLSNTKNDGMFLGRNPPKSLSFARVGSTYRLGKVSTTDDRVGSRGSAFRENNCIRHLDILTRNCHIDLAVNIDKEKFLAFMRESIAISREVFPSLIKQNHTVLNKIAVTHLPSVVVLVSSTTEEVVDAITGGYRLVLNTMFSDKIWNPEAFRSKARSRLILDADLHPLNKNRKIGDRSHVLLANRERDIADFHPKLKQAVFAATKWIHSQIMIGRLESSMMFSLPDSVSHLKLNVEDCVLIPQETEFLTLTRNYYHSLDKDGPLKLTHPECKDLILKLA